MDPSISQLPSSSPSGGGQGGQGGPLAPPHQALVTAPLSAPVEKQTRSYDWTLNPQIHLGFAAKER